MGRKTYQRVVDLLNEHIPAKITRNEFCRVTGVNRNSVDRYRAGLGCPNDETLQKLAAYFDEPVSWLRGETPGSIEFKKSIEELHLSPDNEVDRELISMLKKTLTDYDEINLKLQKTEVKLAAIEELLKSSPVNEKHRSIMVQFSYIPAIERGEVLNMLREVHKILLKD